MDTRMISKVRVYGIADSVIASGYPMDAAIVDKYNHKAEFDRADRLAALSDGHDNFLSGILVAFDLNCSIKMWTEFQRYHFAQIVSSQSTMHRLPKMDIPGGCVGYVDPFIIHRVSELQNRYASTNDPEDFLKLVYSCPVGMKLTARVTTNYLQLKTIYRQRKNHRLPEWRVFCDWVETLPNAQWITGEVK